MDKILLSFLFTVIIYLLIPSASTLIRFFRWRKYREKVRGSLLFPLIGKKGNISPGENFRFHGRFNALDERRYVWIKGPTKTISVPFESLDIYMLPENHTEIVESDSSLSLLGTKHLINYSFKTLEEGTPVFIFGKMPVSGNSEKISKRSLIMIIHQEAMNETLIPSAVFTGDVPYVWFNSGTILSWSLGVVFFLLLSLFPAMFSSYRFLFKVLISEALFPLLFFSPPGAILSFLCFRLWRKGRKVRRRYELKKLFSFCEENLTFIGQGDFECIRKICFEQNVLGEELRRGFSVKGSLIVPSVLYIVFAILFLLIGVFGNFILAIILFGKIGVF